MALGIRTQEQRIAAGSDFDGTEPVGESIHADNIEAFPEGVVGGLFDLGLTEPVFVRSVEIKLGGQSEWTMHKKDLAGGELLILCGSDETDFITTAADAFLLMAKQKLVLRTTGASGAMFCRVSIQAAV